MLKKVIASCLLTCAAGSAMAQDSTKSLTFSGYVDAYYRVNGGKDTMSPGVNVNSPTSFTKKRNAFELGMASIRADATALSGKVTATVDLGVGSRAEEFSYNDAGLLSIIKQAYVTYAPVSAVKFTVGKFGTHVGYELLDAPLNRNYSMSYMFTNGPFFHTGIKADFTVKKFGFMVGVANHVDQTTASDNVKDVLAQVSVAATDKLKFYVNYWGYFGDKTMTTGAESKNQVDFVFLGTISSKFNVGVNATMQSWKLPDLESQTAGDTKNFSWFGAAAYLNYDPIPALGITLRGEYIGDKDKFYYGTKNVIEGTLSLNYKVGPFIFIPEVRLDNTKDEFFYKNNGGTTKTTVSGIFAAIYKF